MRILWSTLLVCLLPGCASSLRSMCKQTCLEQSNRCRGSSQGSAGTACDQDLSACLNRCSR